MSHWWGDEGYTDCLDRKWVPKHDLRLEVLGTLDEANSALGLARALGMSAKGMALILVIQEDLCWMMSELAADDPDTPHKRPMTTERIQWLDEEMLSLEKEVPRPSDFVAPGDHVTGAALQLARAIIRRAERHVVQLVAEDRLYNPQILRYLNHLSMFIYALARHEEAAAGLSSPKPAKSFKRGEG